MSGEHQPNIEVVEQSLNDLGRNVELFERREERRKSAAGFDAPSLTGFSQGKLFSRIRFDRLEQCLFANEIIGIGAFSFPILLFVVLLDNIDELEIQREGAGRPDRIVEIELFDEWQHLAIQEVRRSSVRRVDGNELSQ